MNTAIDDIDKLKNITMAVWLITGLLLVAGYLFFRNIISFLLIKLYELFIGSKNHLAPY
jgi:hypothetical protein